MGQYQRQRQSQRDAQRAADDGEQKRLDQKLICCMVSSMEDMFMIS